MSKEQMKFMLKCRFDFYYFFFCWGPFGTRYIESEIQSSNMQMHRTTILKLQFCALKLF